MVIIIINYYESSRIGLVITIIGVEDSKNNFINFSDLIVNGVKDFVKVVEADN